MAGPLSKVNTTMAAINLDISRKLYWGKGITLEFLVPDQDQDDGQRVVLTLTKGFDRVQQDEVLESESRTVIYRIADIKGTLEPTLRLADLRVRADGLLSQVNRVPVLAPNEARVYDLTCKSRIIRANFDNNK